MPIIHRDTDYALRALMTLARDGGVVSVSDLSEQCNVPVDFLRKIMQKLHREGIVRSVQGPTGGYGLQDSPEDIDLLRVLRAVQGPVVVNACFDDPGMCDNTESCPVREKLADLEVELCKWFQNMALSDMLREGAHHGAA